MTGGQHDRIKEATDKAAKSQSEETALATSQWLDIVGSKTNCATAEAPGSASFSRSWTSGKTKSNGEKGKRPLEMLDMPALKQGKCWLLRCMWLSLGTVLGQELQPFSLEELCRGRWSEFQLAEMGPGLGAKLGSEAKESEAAPIKKSEDYKERRWEVRKKWRKGERWTESEVAYSSLGLFEDQGHQETGDCSAKDDATENYGTIDRGAGFAGSFAVELSGGTSTRSSSKSGSVEEIYYDGPEKTHRPIDKSQEGLRSNERGQIAAHGSVETTCHQFGREHESTAAAIQHGLGRFRDLRGGAGANVRSGTEGNPGNHTTDEAGRGRRHGHQGGRFWTTCRRCRYADRSRQRGRAGEHKSTRDGSGRYEQITVVLCRVYRFDLGREEVKSTGCRGWQFRRRTGSEGSEDEPGFLRRRSGDGLAAQSESSERDQHRYLRFYAEVEVLEYKVGYDAGNRTFTEHWQTCKRWRTLRVPKMPLWSDRRQCMTTQKAVFHVWNHTVRGQLDYLDVWAAVRKAFELEREVQWELRQEISAEHDEPQPVCNDHPEHDEQTQIPIVQIGMHGPQEIAVADDPEVDLFGRMHGGVRAVHHIEWAHEEVTPDLPLVLVTYGLQGTYRGRRDFTCSASLFDVWQGVFRAWPELHDHQLYFVDPQPLVFRWPAIVFIVEDPSGRADHTVPLLLNFINPGDLYLNMWDLNTRAVYFRTDEIFLSNIENAGVEDICVPNGLRICQVSLGGMNLNILDRPFYVAGALCDVRIDPFPEEWSAALEEIPNFEQLATTILMLRREGTIIDDLLRCVLHGIDSEGRASEQYFSIHWSATQHPIGLGHALREAGIDYEVIALVWPQTLSLGREHLWRFVGGQDPGGDRTWSLAVVYSRTRELVHYQATVNDPVATVAMLVETLELPLWCEEGNGLSAYRRDFSFCRHGVHGRRIDLGVDDAEETIDVLSLMQTASKIRRVRDDDGQARVEEVIENYQTLSAEETEQEDAEMNEDSVDRNEDDIELGDPEEEPDEPPENGSQHDSEHRIQGMLFRKGRSADNVWVRHDDQTEFVEDIAHQISVAPRHILGIHTIDPGPFDRPPDGFCAIVRCVGDQYTDTLECLTLVDVFIYTRADVPQEPALFRNVLDLPRLMTRRQLLERIGLEPMCVARRNRCLVKVEGQAIPLQHTGPIFAQHGSYIVVRVPPFEPDDLSCEEVAMVQTRSIVRTIRTLHLFRISSKYQRVQIRWSDTEDLWLTDRIREVESEIVEDLRTLHEVLTLPRDLELTREPVFLVEGWGDRGRQLCVTDKLVLLDFDIRQSSQPMDNYQLRKVVWMRERITRTSLLMALRVFQHCIAETYQGCHVFLNHVEIKDETIRQVWDGDYLRIVIYGRDLWAKSTVGYPM